MEITMRRETEFIEGFDCRGGTCDLPKIHGGDCRGKYGCHGDEWVFVVYDDEGGFALSLEVFTDNLRGVEGELARRGRALGLPHKTEPPKGAWLTLHRKYPSSSKELLGKPEPCDYVGLCYAGSLECSASVGDDSIWKPFGNGSAGLDQSEEFWLAMERILKLWTEDKQRADLEMVRCGACDGTGVVKLAPGEKAVIVDSRAKAVAEEVGRDASTEGESR
jgi:hypothetical protein